MELHHHEYISYANILLEEVLCCLSCKRSSGQGLLSDLFSTTVWCSQLQSYTILAKTVTHPSKTVDSGIPITSMATGVWNQALRHTDCIYKYLWNNGSLSGDQWSPAWYHDATCAGVQVCFATKYSTVRVETTHDSNLAMKCQATKNDSEGQCSL